MKKILSALILALLVLPACAQASTVVLQWDATTDTTVTGQKIYYSNTNAQPFNGTGAVQGASGFLVPKGTGATISGLDSAKAYFFAVTNYNATLGMESVYSNIVTVPAFPTTPANLRSISINVSP